MTTAEVAGYIVRLTTLAAQLAESIQIARATGTDEAMTVEELGERFAAANIRIQAIE